MTVRMRTKGFTLIELLVVIAIIALLVSILLPALSAAKRTAKLVISQANMRQYSLATNNYSTDNREIISGYTPPNVENGSYRLMLYNGPGLPETPVFLANEVEWMSYRGYDLIRRLSTPDNLTIAPVGNWLPQLFYSHLPLINYLAKRLPEGISVCPEDTERLRWQEKPLSPVIAPDGSSNPRWPYSSSYLYSIHATFPDRHAASGASIVQGSTQGTFLVSGATNPDFRLSRRRMSDVKHVSRKVAWYEEYDDHSRRPRDIRPYFMAPAARTITTFFDGSASIVKGTDMNYGAYTLPNNVPINAVVPYDATSSWTGTPWFNGLTTFTIQGAPPPVLTGPSPTPAGGNSSSGFRWTNGGLKGVDVVGGRE